MMKYQYKKWNLLFCLLLMLGMMSCQEDEIIPLKTSDLGGEEIVDDPTPWLRHFVVNKDGEVIGYMNKKQQMVNRDGNILPVPEFDARPQLRVTLYEHDSFKGKQYFLYSTDTYFNISNLKGIFNDKVSSVITSPSCSATMFQHKNYDGRQVSIGKGSYNTYIGSYMNDRSSSIQTSCSSDVAERLCGFAFQHPDFGGLQLPIYDNRTDYSMPSWWASNISSYGHISTDCPGVTFKGSGKVIWLDQSYRNFGDFGMDNKFNVVDVEGCTEETTGFSLDAYNEGARMHRTIYGFSPNGRTTVHGSGFWHSFTSNIVSVKVATFGALTASAILTFMEAEPYYAMFASAGVATVTCAVSYTKKIKIANDSYYTNKSLMPAGQIYTAASEWMRGNLKVAALRGFYFPNKANFEQYYENVALAMEKAKWLKPLPNIDVPVDFNDLEQGGTPLTTLIEDKGWDYFQSLMEHVNALPQQNGAWYYGIKNWMFQNTVEQQKVIAADFYMTASETVAGTAGGIVGGYFIGTGIDAVAAHVKIAPADLPNRYLQGDIPNSTRTGN